MNALTKNHEDELVELHEQRELKKRISLSTRDRIGGPKVRVDGPAGLFTARQSESAVVQVRLGHPDRASVTAELRKQAVEQQSCHYSGLIEADHMQADKRTMGTLVNLQNGTEMCDAYPSLPHPPRGGIAGACAWGPCLD